MLRSPAGVLTADEAYTGIQSFEILGGQFPLVLGGTAYTLPFEAYLYAPIAAPARREHRDAQAAVAPCRGRWRPSPSVLGTARLVGRRAGAIAAAMCWVTPGALLLISVTAYSAYASGLAVTAAAFVAAGMVVDAQEPRRWTMFGFGLLAGFGFWLHPMFLATLVPMVLVVLWMQRRWLVTWVLVIGGASWAACRCCAGM